MQTVDKTLDILELFLKHNKELGISEIAALSNLSVAGAYRITSSLVKRGYLNQKEKRGKYSIGLKLLEFNAVIHRELKIIEISLPFLNELSKLGGESVNMTVLDSNEALSIAQVEVNRIIRVSVPVGARLPLYATSSGKILLANMEKEQRLALYNSIDFIPYTTKTKIKPEEIELELEKIRKEGIAVDDQEWDMNLWSVSAPVFDSSSKVVAALAIVLPLVNIQNNDTFDSLTSLTNMYALKISQEMGYKK